METEIELRWNLYCSKWILKCPTPHESACEHLAFPLILELTPKRYFNDLLQNYTLQHFLMQKGIFRIYFISLQKVKRVQQMVHYT